MKNPVWEYLFGPPEEKRTLIELLEGLPAFDGLSSRELLTVERIIHQRRYNAGEIIFSEDMLGAGMYIVKEGQVVITKRIEGGKEIELAHIEKNSFFGEMALIDEMPRSASAMARKDTILLALCKPDLENMMERNPRPAARIITNIARLVCRRLVQANQNLEQLQKKLEDRGA